MSNLFLLIVLISTVQCNVLKDVDDTEDELQSFLSSIGMEDSDIMNQEAIKDHKNAGDGEEGKAGASKQTKNPPNKRKSKTENICPSVEKVLNSLNFGMIPEMPVSPAVSYMGVKCVTEYVCFNVCYMVNCRNVCKNRQQCHLPY